MRKPMLRIFQLSQTAADALFRMFNAVATLVLLMSIPEPALAIQFPLSASDVARATAFGESAATASDLLNPKLEWYVPCAFSEPEPTTPPSPFISEPDGFLLAVETPFYLVAQNAFLKRDNADYVHDSKVYASLLNKHGLIQVRLTIGSEDVDANTDPLFEIHQGSKIVRSHHPKIGLPSVTGTLFFREIEALFDMEKFDFRRDFDV